MITTTRQTTNAELSQQGMSTRAIAPIVGVDPDTVRRDVARAVSTAPVVNLDTGEVIERDLAAVSLDTPMARVGVLPKRNDSGEREGTVRQGSSDATQSNGVCWCGVCAGEEAAG